MLFAVMIMVLAFLFLQPVSLGVCTDICLLELILLLSEEITSYFVKILNYETMPSESPGMHHDANPCMQSVDCIDIAMTVVILHL